MLHAFVCKLGRELYRNFLEWESRLVIQLYKSNATSALVARWQNLL